MKEGKGRQGLQDKLRIQRNIVRESSGKRQKRGITGRERNEQQSSLQCECAHANTASFSTVLLRVRSAFIPTTTIGIWKKIQRGKPYNHPTPK